MSEEMKNNEVTEVTETYENCEVSSGNSGVGKVIIGVGALVGTAVVGLAIKNKDKIGKKRADKMKKKLEKLGYTVEEPEVEEVESEIVEDEETEE